MSHELQAALANIVAHGDDLEGLDRKTILKKAAAGEVLVLDVRPSDEYAAAHLLSTTRGRDATLSYFFGCSGIGKAVALDVAAGDEDWFIPHAAKVGVPISTAALRSRIPGIRSSHLAFKRLH